MNNNFLIDLALVSTFVETEKNYYSIYLPFVIKLIPQDNGILLSNLSKLLETNEKLFLPLHVIRDMLNSYKNLFSQYDKPKDSHISLTDDGKKILDRINSDSLEISKSLSELYEDFILFASDKYDLNDNLENVKEYFQSYIEDNLLSILKNEQPVFNRPDGKYFIIFKYLAYLQSVINTEKSNLYETFNKIACGAILKSQLIHNGGLKKENLFRSNLNIYLDSDFMLSLLELNYDINNKSAIELYNAIKKIKNISLNILDITHNEIVGLLNNFNPQSSIQNQYQYGTIYRNLVNKGINKTKIMTLMSSLENKYKELGINLINCKNIESDDYYKIYDIIYKYKKDRNERTGCYKSPSSIHASSQHDAQAIINIVEKCNKRAKTLENARAIFLTSTASLTSLEKEFYPILHATKFIALDSIFSIKLFLSDPISNSTLPLDTILKSQAGFLLADSNIWNTFFNILTQLRNEGSIDQYAYQIALDNLDLVEKHIADMNNDEICLENVSSMLSDFAANVAEKNKQIKKYEQEQTELLEEINNKNQSKELLEKTNRQLVQKTEELHFKNYMQDEELNFERKYKKFKDKVIKKGFFTFLAIITIVLASVISSMLFNDDGVLFVIGTVISGLISVININNIHLFFLSVMSPDKLENIFKEKDLNYTP